MNKNLSHNYIQESALDVIKNLREEVNVSSCSRMGGSLWHVG